MSIPTESEEQQALFEWAQYQKGKYPEIELLYHTPNGGRRGKAEAGRFKAEGVKSGVPDLFLPVARGGYFGLYVEMKRRKGGKESDAQLELFPKLRKQGYKVETCKGWEAAAQTIIKYMALKPTEWSVKE
ncbi:MAG: VRR-NUC domain-containing protein [Defluviitaleaceae bacterium]|nr:VRR-NUC domain-containing protein [Defluviitaleaceae bacterium]